jgi:hypothetical protein
MKNRYCSHISLFSPASSILSLSKKTHDVGFVLPRIVEADAFGSATAHRGRMNPANDCFVLNNSEGIIKTVLFPLRPSKAACNVYGSVHGGALWSFSDFASSLHFSLFLYFSWFINLQNNARNDDNDDRILFQVQNNFQTVNANCRYHNGVAQDTPLVCLSTIISGDEEQAHFQVDLVPEKFTPLKFDAEKDEWKLRPEEEINHDGECFLAPESTFTRATFTKKINKMK